MHFPRIARPMNTLAKYGTLLFSLCILSSRVASAQDSVTSTLVCPGVTHVRLLDRRGPWIVNMLQIDLRQRDLTISAGRAFDRFFGREQTSSIAKRHAIGRQRVVAALNSDFFSLKTGEIENNNIIDGEFIKGTSLTGSPFDTFDNIHSQFAMTVDRKPLIDRFAFTGKVIWSGAHTSDLTGINDVPNSRSTILFTGYYGPTTPTDTLKMQIRELSLGMIKTMSDTLVGIISDTTHSGGSPLGRDLYALSFYEMHASALAQFHLGDTIRLSTGLRPQRGKISTLVGGWPRIVLDGRNIAATADSTEGTFPRFSTGRHPRSGVGFSKDSTMVYFVVVDGRSQKSAGMSLIEFGDLMVSSGIYQGMNLDGGGSTTLVINGAIVNTPSDATGERPVGNCLLLLSRTQ